MDAKSVQLILEQRFQALSATQFNVGMTHAAYRRVVRQTIQAELPALRAAEARQDHPDHAFVKQLRESAVSRLGEEYWDEQRRRGIDLSDLPQKEWEGKFFAFMLTRLPGASDPEAQKHRLAIGLFAEYELIRRWTNGPLEDEEQDAA